jgi:hypothetical protein
VFKLARARMRRNLRPGLVIVVPAEAGPRQQLADDLGVLLGGHAMAGRGRARLVPEASRAPGIDLLLTEAVVMCLPVAFARAAFPGMGDRTAVLLLSPEGARVAELASAPDLFQGDAVARLTELLHGPGDQRLEEITRLQREALGRDLAARIDTALVDLASATYRERERATALLQSHAPRITSVLVHAVRQPRPLEAKRRLERLLAAVLRPADAAEALPFGVAFERQHFDPCPGCGRAIISEDSARFLRLLRFTAEPRR